MYAKKEKNIITFTTEEGKNYIFDITNRVDGTNFLSAMV